MRTFFVLVALLLIAGLVSAAPFPFPGRPGTYGDGPSPQWTLDDDWEDGNIDGWTARNGVTCFQSSSDLITSVEKGACHYDPANDSPTGKNGAQPTDDNQWIVFEFGTSTPNVGGSLRALHATPTTDEYNYVVRCTGSIITIRVCDLDAQCLTIADDVACTNFAGDQMALMVAGTTDATELCGWYWEEFDTEPSSWNDPGTWGDADFCTTSTSSITLLSAYTGGGTTVEDWDTTSSTGPDDLAGKGFPAIGQSDVAMYTGTTSGAGFEWMIAGDLNL